MRRFTRGDHVLYVQRHWKMSLVFFVLGMALLAAFPYVPTARHRDDPPADVYCIGFGGICLAVAFIFQFKRRAIVIDPRRGILVIVERLSPVPSRPREFSLSRLQIRTSSFEARGNLLFSQRMNFIWLDIPGHPAILFEGNITDRRKFQDLVTQLRWDLVSRPVTSED